MNFDYGNFTQENKQLFDRLKDFKSTNKDDLIELIEDYENLEYRVRQSNTISPNQKSDCLLIVGRALSNLIYKAKELRINNSHNDFIELGSHIVFLAHRGGLCNRLRALATLAIISNELGCEFSWHWCATLSCNGDIPKNTEYKNLSTILKNIDPKFIVIDEPNGFSYFFEKYKKYLGEHSYSYLKNQYIRMSKNTIEAMINYYSLSTRLYKFMTDHLHDSYNAVHIRRTDFVEHFREKYPHECLPDIQDYINHIKKNGSAKYFLSTDDVSVKNKILTECSNVVAWNHQHNVDRLRQVGFVETILDLALLINSDKLLVTPHSSFSQYAAEAGGVAIVNVSKQDL